jgi:hypothetical protein
MDIDLDTGAKTFLWEGRTYAAKESCSTQNDGFENTKLCLSAKFADHKVITRQYFREFELGLIPGTASVERTTFAFSGDYEELTLTAVGNLDENYSCQYRRSD